MTGIRSLPTPLLSIYCLLRLLFSYVSFFVGFFCFALLYIKYLHSSQAEQFLIKNCTLCLSLSHLFPNSSFFSHYLWLSQKLFWQTKSIRSLLAKLELLFVNCEHTEFPKFLYTLIGVNTEIR